MRKKVFVIFLVFSVLLFVRCITEYTPNGIENVSGILVVEGIISEGETVIKLTRSIGIEDDFSSDSNIYNAKVRIECNNGTAYGPLGIGDDGYHFSIDHLDKDKEYRLNIDYAGNQYHSEFLKPVLTPDIDEIYYEKRAKGEPVKIFLSTHNDNEGSNYYIWSYLEEWEYHSYYESNLLITYDEDGEKVETKIDRKDPRNTYFCWGKNTSKNFILGSTTKLTSNTVKDFYLTESSPHDLRWQTLYRITVKQNCIRKEAFDYFSNLRKNVEENGSIFTPIPSEMNGNIKCINDPDIPVIGYIDVSLTKKGLKYVQREEVYESEDTGCTSVSSLAEAIENGYEVFYKDFMLGGYSYAARKCFDCNVLGGTKTRPDDWPTNNY